MCSFTSTSPFLRFADTDSGNNIGENQGLNYTEAIFSPGSVPVPCAYRLALHQTLKKTKTSAAYPLLSTEELQMDTTVIAHKEPAVRLL